MKRILLSSFFLILTLSGCKKQRFLLVNLPYCLSGKAPSRFKKSYVLAIKGGSESYRVFSGREGGPRRIMFRGDSNPVFAFVSCSQKLTSGGGIFNVLKKGFSETHIPNFCKGQKTIIHTRLKATQQKKARMFGFDGFLEVPKLSVACKHGTSSQENNRTLRQIVFWLNEGVDQYKKRFGSFPKSPSDYKKAGYEYHLGMDPWGQATKYQRVKGTISITSAGPDKRFGTNDDIEIFRVNSRGSRRHLLVFEDTSHTHSDDFRAFIKKSLKQATTPPKQQTPPNK